VLVRRLFLGGDASIMLDPDTKLVEEGICDSLGLVTLALELEKQYPPLRILDQEITRENLASIRDILLFLGRKGFETAEG